ncbi:MAG TPA: hypothetical protein VFZ21_17110 [Gemmatimonadaceae bacterium]|jgi:hypothetical protein|nr:hypothetical protein [Gemmatimonadaceae bacterium]
MTSHFHDLRRVGRRTLGACAVLLATVAVQGCDSSLLEVEDPDVINPGDLNTPTAAEALRFGVLSRLTDATTGDENAVLLGGLLADEWRSGDTFEQRNTTDQRAPNESNTFIPPALRSLARVRVEALTAIDATREFDPEGDPHEVGKMFAFSAFAVNLAGETFCNGLPFSQPAATGSAIEFGEPVTVDSAFALAIAQSDSALALSTASSDEAEEVRYFAAVLKGRALLNRGRFEEAAAAVADVPTDFEFAIAHSPNSTSNQIWSLNNSAKRYVLADLEGVNGLPFRSARDPRLTSGGSGNSFDSSTPFVQQTKWGRYDPVVIVSGIEARLIEAEVALRAGDAAGALATLNALRSSVEGLDPLEDAGSDAARVDQVFSERGFWLFGTGHRLGDLRRLVRYYDRNAESVFPTGAFHKGGNYGDAVNFPVPLDERNNPNFQGCLDRNA